MSIRNKYNRIFLSRYNEKDIFTRASANFLIVICIVFFTVMFIMFFVNLKVADLLTNSLSSGASCLCSLIVLRLIMRGRVWAAGTFMTIFQSLVLLAVGLSRTPEMALAVSLYFCFPLILLAVIYTKSWINFPVLIYMIALSSLNILRFSESASAGQQEAYAVFIRTTATGMANLIMVYILAFITMRSLKLALRISQEETKKSSEKNDVITRLMEMIRKSYQDLTTSIEKTDTAINGIFENVQTEASTIEEITASIEEIASSTDSIKDITVKQSDSVHELSESIKNLSGLIDSLQELGNALQSEFTNIGETAKTGNESSESLETVNRKTMKSSDNIASITGIIYDIFDRINLLSLNAAIEAARAGEHGRGFAVVADEIGKLADNSSTELNKIKELINTNRSDVEFSSSIIKNIINFINSLNKSLANVQDKAMNTLAAISQQKEIQGNMLNGTNDVYEKSEFIKSSSAEQSAAIQEVAKAIENTNSIVQSNTADARVLIENYENLKSVAANLRNIIFAK